MTSATTDLFEVYTVPPVHWIIPCRPLSCRRSRRGESGLGPQLPPCGSADDDVVTLGDGKGQGLRHLGRPYGVACRSMRRPPTATWPLWPIPTTIVWPCGVCATGRCCGMWGRRRRSGPVQQPSRRGGGAGTVYGERRGLVGGGRFGESSCASRDPHGDGDVHAAERCGHHVGEHFAWPVTVCIGTAGEVPVTDYDNNRDRLTLDR
jgi:hypothetical protein